MSTVTYRAIFDSVTSLTCFNTALICVTTPLSQRIACLIRSNIVASNLVGIVPTVILAITNPSCMDTISSKVAFAKVGVVNRDTVCRLAIHFVRTIRAIRIGVTSQKFHHAFTVLASEKAILRTSTV